MERKYESLVLLKPDSTPEVTQGTLDKIETIITTNGGNILEVENWGKKKLAYDVQKLSKGIYVLYTFLSSGTLILELERNLRINREVMKFLTVILDEKPDVAQELADAEHKREETARKAKEALERQKAEAEALEKSVEAVAEESAAAAAQKSLQESQEEPANDEQSQPSEPEADSQDEEEDEGESPEDEEEQESE